MQKNLKQQIDSGNLRSRLKLKSLQSERKLLEDHSEAKQFFETFKLRPGQIRKHATNLLASGALAGSILLSAPTALPSQNLASTPKTFKVATTSIDSILPKEIQPLTTGQEDQISKIIKQNTGITAVASLEGNKLNDDYGRMGAEQHLPRWPGDSVYEHGEFIDKGMTPGLGGWGYVSDPIVEKYYVAVQTLYLPDWNTNTAYLSKWYKFRKVAVLNPKNGKIIIAAIADAGPSQWTGKKFGGSPEVMAYLGINYGMQNHPVVLFFVDDKENKVPLGPVEYNIEAVSKALADKA